MSGEDSFHCHQFSTSIDGDSSFAIRLPSEPRPLRGPCWVKLCILSDFSPSSGTLLFPFPFSNLLWVSWEEKWPPGNMNSYSALLMVCELGAKETHTQHIAITTKNILPFCTNTSWYRITDFGTLGVTSRHLQADSTFLPCCEFSEDATMLWVKFYWCWGKKWFFATCALWVIRILCGHSGVLFCFNAFVVLVARRVGSIYKGISIFYVCNT